MWIGCSKGRNECATLSADIDERLAALGFERERRSFSPHLTMARIKRAENDPWREIMDKLAEIQWPELTMDRFILWQSELSPQGPKYTALEEFGAGE
jgi:2'-5' RNA ligase